ADAGGVGDKQTDIDGKEPVQVDEPEQKQDEHEGRRPEHHRGLAALASFTLAHGYPPFRRKCRARSAAGPSRMTQSVGKMHPSIGSSIFSDAFAPRSWAARSRRIRTSSDWIRRMRATPDPSCSDWTIAWTT